jgi:acetylcholinesterase
LETAARAVYALLLRLRTRLLATAMFLTTLILFYSFYAATLAKPVPYSKFPRTPLIANLPGYGTLKGTQVLKTSGSGIELAKPVDAWLGVEYATQPVGALRFTPPTWPKAFNGTRDASQYGPICIQNPGSLPQDEACLSLNVYRSSGVSYSQKLPVMMFIHGGSFVGGHGRSFDGAAFVNRSSQPVMVVTMQYRLGALGSLPSKLMEEEGLLNLGMLDQKLCLQFLQRYISYFGGDNEKVTVAGQSAGGHSVGIHLFHDYAQDAGKPLFHQAILSSGSPTARAFPSATYPLYERQFLDFMSYIQCPTSPNSASLACLRSVDIGAIQKKSADLYSSSEFNITWPWQPVSPGPLLEKRGSQSGIDKSFFKVPTLITSVTDEGKAFAPKNLTTTTHFTSFLRTMNPGLTDADLLELEMLYPNPDDVNSPYASSPISYQYNRIAAAVGDYGYICPVQSTARLLADAGAPVYKARFNTPNGAPAWQGVPHASDAAYFNGVPNVQFPALSELYSSYWASFVVSGNPNTYSAHGAPDWYQYKGLGGGELKVGSANATGTMMEEEKQGIRMVPCAWWNNPERMARLNK